MEFIGRESELARMEELYQGGRIRTLAIYGRRRIGKTELIRQFVKGKDNLFITIPEGTDEAILSHLSIAVSEYTGANASIRSVQDLVDFLRGITSRDGTVVVIDEFPYLAEAFPETATLFKEYIDLHLPEQGVFLIVCGSSVSAMREVLNEGSKPLFKRFPVQMKIGPLSYRKARLFHPDLPEEDRIRMYCIASGVPMYHLAMAGGTPEEAIRRLFLGDMALMKNEARDLIVLELSPWRTYASVVESMTSGATELNDIAQGSGMSKSACLQSLKDLELLGVAERRVPYGAPPNGRKVAYRITDGFMSFSYSVLARNIYARDAQDTVKGYSALRHRIETFYGGRFEDVCRQYVEDTEACEQLGSWWGKLPVSDEDGNAVVGEDGKVVTESVDIDIAATVADGSGHAVLLGECRFTNRRSGLREFEELVGRGRRALRGEVNVRYIMFSRSGFTPELEEIAASDGDVRLKLVTMEDLRGWAEG